MLDSVNILIMANIRLTLEDSSEQLGISVSTSNKIVRDDFASSKVSCC